MSKNPVLPTAVEDVTKVDENELEKEEEELKKKEEEKKIIIINNTDYTIKYKEKPNYSLSQKPVTIPLLVGRSGKVISAIIGCLISGNAFAPLSINYPIQIEDFEVVKKSYPNFWVDIESVGFQIIKS